MSGSCLAALQTATHAALIADATLLGLIGGTAGDTHVYDEAPENSAHPYVTHGDAQEDKDDTFSKSGKRAHFAVEVWSRYRGSLQVKQVANRIAQVLDGVALSIASYVHTRTVHDRTIVQRQADGVSRWAAVWFTAFLREA